MNDATQSDKPASRRHWPEDHPEVRHGRVGVLLINLGTPDGTDYKTMRRYLAEFLTDRRVIEKNPILWYPILYAIVLNKRPQKSGKLYESIWNKERNESPLRTYTRSQAEKLAISLSDAGGWLSVDWAMRYGKPSVEERILALMQAGCDRVLLFPLYPQYAASTTASANDAAFRALLKMRWQPAIRTVPPYHDAPVYIEALARSVKSALAKLDFEPEKVLASYHGLPVSYFKQGDPYHCHCMKTSRLLCEALGWDNDRLVTTFQSRLGPEEWLKPYTDATLDELPQRGIKRIAIVTPGFSSDCLETLEEIAVRGEESFHAAGGEKYAYIPCLNDSPEGMHVIATLVRRELMGWI
ncbi:MAG: ferrochelatase [Hyphomicrobiaceae bacterium]|nr:MAG: ferrochelatase [Hyphomicrobiaceae bacterium]